MPARELLALKPGDVLSLGHAVTQPVEVHIGQIRRFGGRLTQHGNSAGVLHRIADQGSRAARSRRMTATSLNRELCASLVEELGSVVGAMIESPATVVPGAPAKGRQWVADIRAEGELTGAITVVLDHAGATAITNLMTGIEGAIPDEALLDTLREVLAQAVGGPGDEARGRRRDVVGYRGCTEATVANREGECVRILRRRREAVRRVGRDDAGQVYRCVGCSGEACVCVQEPLPRRHLRPRGPWSTSRIDVILDIDLPVVVRFGHTELPLRRR